MTGEIHFETPENIRVSYRPAGPGTRFVAWFVDNILIIFFTIVIIIVLLLTSATIEAALRSGFMPTEPEEGSFGAELYAAGIIWMIVSLGSLCYFGLCELLLRGQTPGKRATGIRVVKADGFALDAASIFVRSVFRVVDHLPVFWIVPLVTPKSQRLGDLVAGTVVIADERPEVGGLRDLASRPFADMRFHFDATVLGRARRQDVEAVERVVERYASLSAGDRELLLERLVTPLAARLRVDNPAPEDRVQFLEDFLAAEYRRQHRKLG